MAWRDSRKSRSRLFLFMSSIVLGIAALVALNGFGENLRREIDGQARELLGADLEIAATKALPDSVLAFLDSIPGTQAKEFNFSSMVYSPKTRESRLTQVRALEGGYPYYGKLETVPPEAERTFRDNPNGLLADQNLMALFGLEVGDSLRVGEKLFAITGTLLYAPSQTGVFSAIAPPVYIPMSELEATGLVQKGSQVRYKYLYKLPEAVDAEVFEDSMRTRLRTYGLSSTTVEDRKRTTGTAFTNLTKFLNLVAFVALLLGSVGVASAIHTYIRDKVPLVAILRCLGLTGGQAFSIYLIQITVMGFTGATLGALLGTLVQQLIPLVLADFLPLDVAVRPSASAILQGMATGLIIAILFGLLPLLKIRRTSPLLTLRANYEGATVGRDPLRFVVYLLIVVFIWLFTWLQVDSGRNAFLFTLFIGVAFLLLTGSGKLVMWLVKHFFPRNWSFALRQGLSSLFRPNNQTLVLIISLGIGTALIATLYFMQALLVAQVAVPEEGDQPNVILFDVQPQQLAGLKDTLQAYDFVTSDTVSVVATRITSLKGRSIQDIVRDTTDGISSRRLTREIRVSFRDRLYDSERLTAGEWVPRYGGEGDSLKVSVDAGFARALDLGIGDSVVFNVQGVSLLTFVGSIREVDFSERRFNFQVIFPANVLEAAPQFMLLSGRLNSGDANRAQSMATMQRAIVEAYPNISIIDFTAFLGTIEDILDKAAFVIQFMALFSILTGFLVLISSVIISRYQRMKESVLLRTIGAGRRKILVITAVEYFILGAIASLTGIVLSLLSSYLLGRFIFEISFVPDLLPMLFTFLIITGLTVVIGLLNIRSILTRPPLEVLRREIG